MNVERSPGGIAIYKQTPEPGQTTTHPPPWQWCPASKPVEQEASA